ncbi:efflux transporter outer membrane subunit [Pseudomonas sp. NPDC088368]|jgi:NodT family efflux transporter outer membrane factor (OMF) lipoprotein|uniref:efflux transporter outer membrane subunit n=1 Tax=Pseudomonas sp. NPDC088368 TaxID=3364453 RepID=UPI0037FAECDF
MNVVRVQQNATVGAQPFYMPAPFRLRQAFMALSTGLSLSLALSACSVGPDYKQPNIELAPFHTDLPQVKNAATAPRLDTWWTGFNDPVLSRLLERALAQNLDIVAAFARVDQARAAAAGAGADLLPTADFDASATVQHQSLDSADGRLARGFPGYDRHQREFNVGPAASWELDLAGGLRRKAAAARAEATAAEADQLGTRITVAADVADAYLQIRGYQARLSVAQNQIDTDQQLLSLVKARVQAGASQDREVAQAEALLQQAMATVPTLRTALEAQLNRLDVLLGVQPGTYAQELAAPSDIPGIPSISDSARPVDVLRRRPDIIAAERRLAAANERIGAAVADYYPKLSLSAVLGFDNTHASHLFNSRTFQPIGVAALRWRLFDFGKVAAEVAQAKGENAEALALYRQAALRASEDVENAVTALTQSSVRQQVLENEVASLQRARNLSESAYKAGSITLTDVLDSDRQLLAARDDLDGTRANSARAAVSVFRSLGGGWDEGAEVASHGKEGSAALAEK